MDLLIAIMQRAAIHNIGRLAVDRVRRQRPWRHSANDLAIDDLGRRADGVDEVTAIRSQFRSEICRYGAEVRLLGDGDSRIPSLEAIDVGRRDRALGPPATWL